VEGHAEQHFQQSQHTFALELETQRVWDYAGDKFVPLSHMILFLLC